MKKHNFQNIQFSRTAIAIAIYTSLIGTTFADTAEEQTAILPTISSQAN